MTTAHNIVPAPGPAFVRPSGGGGPTGQDPSHGRSGRCSGRRRSEPSCLPNSGAHGTTRGPCLVSNNTTGSSQMQPHPTEVPHFFYCRAHLQAIRARNPTVRPWPARDKGRCTSCGAPAAAAAGHDGRPRRVRGGGKDQQHGGSPEHQATIAPDATPTTARCAEAGSAERDTVRSAGSNRPDAAISPSTSQRRHCAKCCVGAAANRSAQVMAPTTIAAGTAARRNTWE